MPVYTPEFLDLLKKTEELLTFSKFDQEDAYVLGTRLREAGMTGTQAVAVRVVWMI